MRVGRQFQCSSAPRSLIFLIGDAGEHVGKPRLRIDVLELGGLNQREHDRGAFAAEIGACEQLCLAAESDAT
jgi:hypothetical protein